MITRPVSIDALVSSGVLAFGDGYRTKRSEHGKPGFRIVRVADVLNDVIHLDGPDFVSEQFERSIGSKVGQTGDILLTTKGTVGRVAVMPPTTERVVYSPQLCYFRVLDDEALHPRFLRYWFSSKEFRDQAAYKMNNTDMAAYINMADIRSLKIWLPPIEEQAAIAEVLGALDDKITANTKLAKTADDWVRAGYSKLRSTGDKSISVADIVTHRRSAANPETIEMQVPYVGLEHLPRRSLWLGTHGLSGDVSSNKSYFHSGDILFGKLRPYFHKIVTAPTTGICSTDILVLTPRTSEFSGYALAALSDDDVVQAVTAASQGTRMPRTSWNDLSNVEVLWPGESAAKNFSARVQEVRAYVIATLAENRTLATTRDTLLPRLMSSEIRVGDAEGIVAARV